MRYIINVIFLIAMNFNFREQEFRLARVGLTGVFLIVASLHTLAQEPSGNKRTGMLVLGSADINTMKERVHVGYNLYASGITFDYIVVSGGCGAHDSNICEASEMAALLKEMGVPANKIYKEERSKNTKQNYCYSRVLVDENGTKVINPKDRLYVVSNHWHAISVAARFSAYDGVDAIYHIEGRLIPRASDNVDYTNIYNDQQTPEEFCDVAVGVRKRK